MHCMIVRATVRLILGHSLTIGVGSRLSCCRAPVPVASLDGTPIGRGEVGPLTQKLMAAFDRFARDPENGTPLA